jgi:hypothetical protein
LSILLTAFLNKASMSVVAVAKSIP